MRLTDGLGDGTDVCRIVAKFEAFKYSVLSSCLRIDSNPKPSLQFHVFCIPYYALGLDG